MQIAWALFLRKKNNPSDKKLKLIFKEGKTMRRLSRKYGLDTAMNMLDAARFMIVMIAMTILIALAIVFDGNDIIKGILAIAFMIAFISHKAVNAIIYRILLSNKDIEFLKEEGVI